MEGVDLLHPFKWWIVIVVCSTVFSFVGTWLVVKKSKNLK